MKGKKHYGQGYRPKGLPMTGGSDPLSSTKPFSTGPGSQKGQGPTPSHPQSDHEQPVFKPGTMKGR